MEACIELRDRTLGLVVNESSGRVSEMGADALVEAVRAALSPGDLRVETVDGQGPQAAFDALVRAGAKAVLIAGGDGTARAVARRAIETGVPMAPLPGGTMNLLARRLYGDADLESVLERLAGGRRGAFPVGLVNDEPFFLSAMFGSAYAWASARETARQGRLDGLRRWTAKLREISRRLFERAVVYAANDAPARRADLLIVANGPVRAVLTGSARDDETDGLTAVAGDWSHLLEAVRAGLLGAAGLSDFDPKTHEFEVVRLTVGSRKRRRTRVVIDGEPMRFDGPVDVRLSRRAVPVLEAGP